MTPEEKARLVIDEKLRQSGWVIQDMKKLNLSAALGVAVREFPTSTGEVDYALFIDGKPVEMCIRDRHWAVPAWRPFWQFWGSKRM